MRRLFVSILLSLFVRSPKLTAAKRSETREDYFVVEDVRFDGSVIRVDCTVRPEEGQGELHAVAVVPLGRLPVGDYTAIASFRTGGGDGKPPTRTKHEFRVR